MRLKTLFVHGWQKLTRGFSDDITYSLDIELAKWLLPRLKRFKELNMGYPDGMTPEGWNETLDRMIRALEIEIHWDAFLRPSFYLSDVERLKHEQKIEREREDGLKLLGKYLSHLWW